MTFRVKAFGLGKKATYKECELWIISCQNLCFDSHPFFQDGSHSTEISGALKS